MLTDAECRNATCPPEKKRHRLTDAAGLYLEISPGGSKRWFLKLYRDGKETRLALGSYPAIGLPAARKARDTAKLKKADGIDPIQARQADKLKAAAGSGDTFEETAREWLGLKRPNWSEAHPADVIEAQLAHKGQITHGGAYDRATHQDERADMLQVWADYLDKLRTGADVIPFNKAA